MIISEKQIMQLLSIIEQSIAHGVYNAPSEKEIMDLLHKIHAQQSEELKVVE